MEPKDYTAAAKKKAAKTEGQEKPKLEKIVEGEVKQVKPGFAQKFKGVFFGGDFKVAASYVIGDVILPAARDLLVNSITKGAERVVYGDVRDRRDPRSFYTDGRPYIQYNNPVRRNVERHVRGHIPDQPARPYVRQGYQIDNLVLANRQEAESIIERMMDIINQYDVASLADIYELLGLPVNHNDNKWGWTYFTTAGVQQTRDGYLLDLPPLEPI